MATSPLKYAGGKRKYADRILKHLNLQKGDRYVEPFLGGGSVFLRAREQGFEGACTLGEMGKDVLDLWDTLYSSGLTEGVIVEVEEFMDDYFDPAVHTVITKAEMFDNLKARVGGVSPAARTILLNRLGYNGLMRYNKKGKFNVGPGKVKGPRAGFNAENLRAVSKALKNTMVFHSTWQPLVAHAVAGDKVFLDPPYLGGFVAYTAKGWTESDHIDLVLAARRAVDRGATVVVTDSGIPTVQARWAAEGFTIEELQEHRAINSDGNKRGKVGCVLAYSGENTSPRG